MDIDIDGTNVSDNGIIIDAGSKVYLERFIDVAKKFKFVSKHSAEVADPSNVDNGKITIKVQKEAHVHHYMTPINYVQSNPDKMTYESGTWVGGNTFYSGVRSCTASYNVGEVGATVEGQHSSQNFTSTVWVGSSGQQFTFEFLLRGKTDKTSDPEFEEYMRLKAKFD